MKQSLLQACLVSGLLVSCALASAAGDEAYTAAMQKFRARQFAQAVSEAKLGLDDPSITPAQKLKLLKLIGDASNRLVVGGAATLQESSQQIMAMKEASPDDKARAGVNLSIALRNLQAGRDLQDMDGTLAIETLKATLEIEGASANALAAVHLELAELYYLLDQYDQALPHFEKVTQAAQGRLREQGQNGLVNTIVKLQGLEKARAYVTANDLDMLSFISRHEPDHKLEAYIRQVVQDKNLTPQTRWQALSRSPGLSIHSTDTRQIIALLQEHAPELLKQDPKLANALLPRTRRAAQRGQYEFVSVAGPLMLANPALTKKTAVEIESMMLDALAWAGRREQLAASAQSLVKDSQASAVIRGKAELVALGIKAGDALEPAAVRQAVSSLNRKDQMDALIAAGRTLLRGGMEAQARAIWSVYADLTQMYQKPTVICRFDDQAPFDLGTWLASPAVRKGEGALRVDRLYGNNLKALLETDSTNTGRGVDDIQNENQQDTRTDFYLACDEHGISLFIRAYDSQAEQANQGLVRAGSYEMYLAPGVKQPYHTFLAPLNSDNWRTTVLQTMYPNRFFRDISREDGNLVSQTRVLPDGFATCIFITWDAFYDKLPVAGQPWQVEILRWTRSGGRSLAGSQSVHNRSSWALMEFENLTAENLARIKRHIIAKAQPRYVQAKRPTGVAGRWADAQIGDPAFYQAKVKPLLDELDRHLIKADQKLTDADVQRIFAQAVPGWMEMEHLIADMRREYLREQLMVE